MTKVCLAFGHWFDLNLDILFKKKGRPIIFGYNSNNVYEANFTLATLSDEMSVTTQAMTTIGSSLPNNQHLNQNDATICQIDKFNITTHVNLSKQQKQTTTAATTTTTKAATTINRL